jgi:excinuclease ABC subunit C
MSRSALDEIDGIGPVKKRSLLRHFGSVAKIKTASLEELCEAEGISRKNAETVYKFFNE